MSSLTVACGLLLFRNLKVKLETAAVKVQSVALSSNSQGD